MKLLFDQNLSRRLVKRLSDIFPDAGHVALLGLHHSSDEDIWQYARLNDCLIVSKDSDFHDLGALRGHPPKVIWLRLGNCTTSEVERVLRRHVDVINLFERDEDLSILVIQ